MEIIFLRHGRTVWNATGRWQGHTDVPLSDDGRKQAEQVALLLEGDKVEAIFSSDLRISPSPRDPIYVYRARLPSPLHGEIPVPCGM